jgi:hypothetical protein
MPEEEQLVKASFNVPVKAGHRSPDYRVFYANQSRLRMAQADFQLYFGLLTDDPNALGTFTNEEILSVIVGPQHAKVIALNLMAAVNTYEAVFGEIQLAPDAIKSMQAVQNQLSAAAAAAKKQRNEA